MSSRCEGLTKGGIRCRRSASSGQYCSTHRPATPHSSVSLRGAIEDTSNYDFDSIIHDNMEEKVCEHTCLLDLDKCCGCTDQRPHTSSYPRYVDGIGMTQRAARHDGYCRICKARGNERDKGQVRSQTHQDPAMIPLRALYQRLGLADAEQRAVNLVLFIRGGHAHQENILREMLAGLNVID